MGASEVVDLGALAHAASVPGVVWSAQSEDLNANLLVFANGQPYPAGTTSAITTKIASTTIDRPGAKSEQTGTSASSKCF